MGLGDRFKVRVRVRVGGWFRVMARVVGLGLGLGSKLGSKLRLGSGSGLV